MTTDEKHPGTLAARDVRRRFDRAATTFAAADFVHRRAAGGLLERMAPMNLEVGRILDAGAAAGAASRALAARFRRAQVISLDASRPMLAEARRSRSRFSRIREIQADATSLPLRTGSIDLVFANMLLPWLDDVPAFLAGIARVLRKGGLFMFSGLGPDTFSELRGAWREIDDGEHVRRFSDMHETGDAIVAAGLRDPVLDVDYLTVTYDDLPSLFADLTATGGRNTLRGRRRALTAPRTFERLRRVLESRAGGGPLSFPLEIVFGHAWGGGPPPVPGEHRLDVASIGRRRR